MKFMYLVAILPPAGLSGEIDDIRKECSEKFKVYKALRPPVHITLYRPVWMESNYEPTFSRLMQQIGMENKPFEQEIEDFGSFGSQVVYIHAPKNPGLIALRQQIVSVFREHKIDPKGTKEDSKFHPHFTIAYRDVLPEVFPKIRDEYKDRKLRRKFLVDQFSVLKHDGKKWNLLEDFSLQKTD